MANENDNFTLNTSQNSKSSDSYDFDEMLENNIDARTNDMVQLEKEKESIKVDKTDEFLDFAELESKLENELELELESMRIITEETENIGNPDRLGKTIKDVVWEQFLNQVVIKAGEDFIEENRGLTLDLRNEAHIQTTENFAKGNIARHNTEIDYQERYDNWQSKLVHDEKGNIIMHKTRSGREEATLVKGARDPFDKGRPTGSSGNHTDMDHTVSAGEIIRDAEANAHMTEEEQIEFANSEDNLNEMDSSLNRSKGDKSMKDWLDEPNSKGQKPHEIFDISKEKDTQLRKKDREARKEYAKQKAEGVERSNKAGRISQIKEAARVGTKALRAVVMGFLAGLIKEVVAHLIQWFKSPKKTFSTLLSSLKDSISAFFSKLKMHIVNAGAAIRDVVVGSIIGPVFHTIKRAFMFIKQGVSSVIEAVKYLCDKENKNKPFSIKVAQVAKILTAGLAAGGAILLSEVFEKALLAIPGAQLFMQFELPLIGSLANIIGIFLGGLVSGLLGAVVLNWLDKYIAKKQVELLTKAKIDKGNEILLLQAKLNVASKAKLEQTKADIANGIRKRHEEASDVMSASLKKTSKTLEEIDKSIEATGKISEEMNKTLEEIEENSKEDKTLQSTFDDIDKLFDQLNDEN